MKTSNNDNNILKRILTDSDIHLMEDAYNYMISMEDGKYKEFLLRRIDDVISMARYIDLMLPRAAHEDYDSLYARLRYLELTLNHLRKKKGENPKFSYSETHFNNPRILTSIGSLDYDRYHEIDELLYTAFYQPSKEMPLYHELKRVKGHSFQLLYAHQGDSFMVYDFYSVVGSLNDLDLDEIRIRCLSELKDNTDPTIQAIYDDIVYSALHFDANEVKGGYRLVKERGITPMK